MQNGETTLSQLLSAGRLNVPIYQRSYAWDEQQCAEFFRDLLDHPPHDASKRHFLGTILLAATSSVNYFDVVDGQQRLTTATIFVAVALDRLRKLDGYTAQAEDFRLGLLEGIEGDRLFRTVSEDDPFFERYIVKQALPSEADFTTYSKRRLVVAKQYFTKQVNDTSPEKISALLKVLGESRVLIYSVNTPSEATQIFEFQNDRGKKLTELERLKSFLMHQVYLRSGSAADINLNVIQQAFADIYQSVERFRAEPIALSADAVLRHHCSAFVPWRNAAHLLDSPKELIRSMLANGIPEGNATSWIKDFAQDLAVSFRTVEDILRERDRSIRLAGLFVTRRVASFWPLLLKIWRLKSSEQEGVGRAVAEMEKLAWRMQLANIRADTLASHLRSEALDFTGGFERLADMLTTCQTWYDMPARCNQTLDSAAFYTLLTTCRYLLWRYENHLLSERGRQEGALSWREAARLDDDPARRLTIDHIQPQGSDPSVLERPTQWDPLDLNVPAKPFKEIFLHRLGNLVLDTTATGSAKSNKNFDERLTHYRASKLKQEHELATFAEQHGGTFFWTEESIRRRHKHLKEFALQYT